MCESAPVQESGWQGWLPIPPAEPLHGTGPWIDLSHSLSPSMPRQPFFPVPVFERFMTLSEHPLNVTHMDVIAHLGTHVDSPRHCFEDAPAFEEVPLHRLCGAGLVWRVEVDSDMEIGPEQLEPAGELLRRGDILLLNTGLHHSAHHDAYQDHPSLSLAGAQWLIDHGVKLIGVDTPTPDAAHHRRPEGFKFPVHRRLLGHGVLIAEHLTNLDRLDGRRVEVLCNALNIAGADGAPCRIVARPLEAQSG